MDHYKVGDVIEFNSDPDDYDHPQSHIHMGEVAHKNYNAMQISIKLKSDNQIHSYFVDEIEIKNVINENIQDNDEINIAIQYEQEITIDEAIEFLSGATASKQQSVHVEDNNLSDLFHQKWTRNSPNTLYLLLYNLISPFIVIAIVGIFANKYNTLSLMFPSLGPTTFLHFAVPNKPPASPQSTLIGHFIGILMGSIALQIFNLYNNDAIFIEGVSTNRIFAAALSVSFTCFSMILFHVEHPPACATTLIVSLGVLKTPQQLSCMMAAVLLLTSLAFIINRYFRKDVIYPIWSKQSKIASNTNNDQNNQKLHQKSQVSLQRQYSSVRFDALGFDEMNLLAMNDKLKKLNEMKHNLSVDNFVEYFEMAVELEANQSMRILMRFAQKNSKRLHLVKRYRKEIPYSIRFMIDSTATLNVESFNKYNYTI